MNKERGFSLSLTILFCMYYEKIHLKNFRNYEDRTFDFHERVNLFIGPNARGKTNLLESLYVTSYGRSFRTTKDREMIRFGEESCEIDGYFKRDITGSRQHLIKISIDKNGRRKGSVDGLPFKKYSDIFDNVLAVIFSPEDLKIIKESPDRRRDFMDRELGRLSPAYYHDSLIYRRALQQRNAYLKEEERDRRMLAVWDENLIRFGSRMMMRRRVFVQKLDKICRKIHHSLTGGQEDIHLEYVPNIHFSENIGPEDQFRRVFAESAEQDLRLRYTSRGPQKDDIIVSLDGIDARTFGSQGQQRTAALSLKMSEVELVREEMGEYPILLLDDVLSELDPSRQQFLLNSLQEVQLFITAADLSPEVRQSLPDGKVIEI